MPLGVVDAVRRVVALPGAHQSSGRQYSLRWALNHTTYEYARRNADLIREAINGEVGE